jgi:hypothetical protein
MEAKTELASEDDTGQEEEKVIELGDVSQETQGGPWGFNIEQPGKYLL